MTKPPQGHIRKRGDRYEIAVPIGRDPITKRYRYVYGSASTEQEAVKVRDELIEQVMDGRTPDSKATVATLLDRWLSVADLELSTQDAHEGYIRRTIKPTLGAWSLRKLQRRVDILDDLYRHLRRCSQLCDERPFVEHRDNKRGRTKDGGHDCAKAGCKTHECKPMAPATIRRVHSILLTAFGFGIKWAWMDRNPAEHASPPKLNATRINPPDPADAAKLLQSAFDKAPDFGAFVWLDMVTGARRGELCPIRWSDFRWEERELLIERAYVTKKGRRIIKDTKTHQVRRLSLDQGTTELFQAMYEQARKLAEQAGVEFDENGYTFSRDGFGEQPWLPDTVTQKFCRMRDALDLKVRLHDLRHFNATQMIANGVDLSTIAGRLGHSGGGSTTLKVYAHWTRPADRQAADLLASLLRRPTQRAK